jgi:hypothetical protein
MSNRDACVRFSESLELFFDKKEIPVRGRASILRKMFGMSQKNARAWIEGLSLPNKNKWDEIYSKLGIDIPSLLINKKEPSTGINSETNIDAYKISNTIKSDYQLIVSEISYCPPVLTMGKDAILYMNNKELDNCYHLYELTLNHQSIKVLCKVKKHLFDKFIHIEGSDIEYRLTDYKHSFLGSLVGIKVLF